MAKNDEKKIKVDVMGLSNLMDILEIIHQRLDEQNERLNVIGRLAVSCSNRITALEQQLAAQGDSMSYRIANVGDLAVTNFKKTSAIEQQGVILAQRCEMRITSIEERLAALEPQGDPDDIRDALMRDALTPLWAFPDDDTSKDDGGADTNNSSDVCWWTQQKDGYTWLSDCGHWQRFSIEWFDDWFGERMRRCQFCGKPARGLVIPVSGTSDEDCE